MPFIQADRYQTTLLGYSLSDLVEPDAKCRFALSLVQRLDLTALRDRYSNRGAEAFDPAMMLALWFYAYCEGITSTRKLEERCERDTHSIYLSANLRPDHTPQYCGALSEKPSRSNECLLRRARAAGRRGGGLGLRAPGR